MTAIQAGGVVNATPSQRVLAFLSHSHFLFSDRAFFFLRIPVHLPGRIFEKLDEK